MKPAIAVRRLQELLPPVRHMEGAAGALERGLLGRVVEGTLGVTAHSSARRARTGSGVLIGSQGAALHLGRHRWNPLLTTAKSGICRLIPGPSSLGTGAAPSTSAGAAERTAHDAGPSDSARTAGRATAGSDTFGPPDTFRRGLVDHGQFSTSLVDEAMTTSSKPTAVMCTALTLRLWDAPGSGDCSLNTMLIPRTLIFVLAAGC